MAHTLFWTHSKWRLTVDVKITRIPHFIQARNPRQLMKRMLANNLKAGKEYKYQITVLNNFLLAWYEEAADIKFPRNESKGVALEGDEK